MFHQIINHFTLALSDKWRFAKSRETKPNKAKKWKRFRLRDFFETMGVIEFQNSLLFATITKNFFFIDNNNNNNNHTDDNDNNNINRIAILFNSDIKLPLNRSN